MLFMHVLSSIDLTHISLPLATVLAPMDDPLGLNKFAGQVRNIITTVGVTIFLISVAVAGIMRMVAFGNERRVALSNMALTAAVVGLIIMLLAQGLYAFINKMF